VDYKKYLYLGTRVDLLESSRGCPYNCKFCCIRKMWKDPYNHLSYRSKSVKRIMEEIYSIDRKNDFIFFCEDNFTINTKRTKRILETIIKSGVPNRIYFSCQSRVDTLYRNPWLVDLLHEAGFRQVFLGIESVHQQSLDAMNKHNTTPKMTRKVVKMLQDRGISIFGGVIIGYPGETKKMVRQTINFAKALKFSCVQFTPITAFPGTEFYDEMKEKGMITSYNFKHYNLFHSMMKTSELSAKEIYRLVGEAYASYYLDKTYIKTMAKRYLNPFGKYNWMFTNILKFIKSVLIEGNKMLSTQGITTKLISKELKEMESHTRRQRPEDFLDQSLFESKRLEINA
ncbi:MAG: B12-binding domain-containing radical SAM protein, partial [Promethearchaeota archaeon]